MWRFILWVGAVGSGFFALLFAGAAVSLLVDGEPGPAFLGALCAVAIGFMTWGCATKLRKPAPSTNHLDHRAQPPFGDPDDGYFSRPRTSGSAYSPCDDASNEMLPPPEGNRRD